MLKRLLVAAALTAVLAPAAEARFDDRDARQLCAQQLRDAYGAHDFRGIVSRRKAEGVFKVAGRADIRGRRDAGFICETSGNRITRLVVQGRPDNSADDEQALAVIAGALVGAAIIGAITDDHRTTNHPAAPRPSPAATQPNVYSPRDGIRCYRDQRKCFRARDMSFAAGMTRHEFGWR